MDIISKSALFEGFDEAKLQRALTLYRAERKSYKKGDFVIHAYKSMEKFGFLIKGNVCVYSDDINGTQMMMANVVPGESFGESLCYLEKKENPVYIIAEENSEILWLDPNVFHTLSEKSESIVFEMQKNFVSVLTVRALSMNDRIQILSKATIREKMITFLTQCERKYSSKTFTVPFDRNALSVYLGVNRSALSRELAQMKKEKIIDFYKNSFKIL